MKKPPAGEYTLADGKSEKYNKKEPLLRHFRILIIVLSWQGHKDLNYPTLMFSLTIVNHTVPKQGIFRIIIGEV